MKTRPNRNDIYRNAIEKWGIDSQLGMLLEESIELAMATRKYLRDGTLKRRDELAGEVADVEIMIEQLKAIYPDMQERVAQIKDEKLVRLWGRINKQ